MPSPKPTSDDPDDIFAETRMSFGDHIEELRHRLFNALKGLAFCLCIGFVLDGIGYSIGVDNFGIGRPIFYLMCNTVEEQVRDYYNRRITKVVPDLESTPRISADDLARISKILDDHDGDLTALSAEDRHKLRGKPEPLPVFIPVDQLTKYFGPPKDSDLKEIEVKALVYPTYVNYLSTRGEALLESRKYLTTLSVQEPFLVYMKVSLLCGLVLGSPYIFYQLWAFVAAGLYRHEKKYVHVFLPFSLSLFLAGVLICQFLVMPNAVKALLGLNSYLGVDPDIRLNEWLTFAILLPLVFGVSFQTPLVMMFLNRIGMFSYKDYLTYWRAAAMILAVGAVLILPTPDVLTMMCLYIPLFGLYMLGIALCKYFPPEHEKYADAEAEQVAV